MKMKFKLGIIGIGNMGSAILNNVIDKNSINCDDIVIFDNDVNKLKLFENKVNISNNIEDLINSSEYILFAIKPQQFFDLAKKISINESQTVISIMAGIQIKDIERSINKPIQIVRIMPNLCCKIGMGISAITTNKIENKDRLSFVKSIFDSCGDSIILEENLFDTVTSISGSGPAYIFYFIKAMIESGIKNGLTFEESSKLTISTFIGATEYVKINCNNIDDIGTSIQNVCSKGGTTIEAINTFDKNNLNEIIYEALDACKNRSEELSKLK